MRKIFTLLLLLIPLWVQAQTTSYTWNETTKTLTIKTDRPYNDTYKTTAETLIIEGTYTAIGGTAFMQYTALKTVEIKEGVTSIKSSAFSGCSSLKEITIPNSVTSIGSRTFENCSSLELVTIPNSVTSIESYAFSGCSALAEITIPNSVTSISSRTFENCSSLESVTIPNSVTSIKSAAFSGCSSLKEITIPNSVTSIGGSVFSGCSALTEITIPGSVTSIEYYAFNGCTALTSIIYNGTGPLTVDTDAFNGISSDATVTVPADYTDDSFGSFSGDKLKKELYAITINATTNGSITATVDEEAAKYVKQGETVTLTVTPDDEYILGTLTVADAQGSPVSVNDNTFTMPAANVTVTATFTAIEKPKPEEPEEPETPVIPDYPDYYNIMVEECEGVTVESSTNVVREGQSMTFTIDIAEGYTSENMTVKVKRSLFGYTEVIEPNNEGIYEIKNIYTDIYITVDGVEEEEETPTGMEDIEEAKVYAKEGSIYVQTPKQEQVQIISISGAVLKNETQVGLQRYDLPRGIYIICIGEERFKVRN